MSTAVSKRCFKQNPSNSIKKIMTYIYQYVVSSSRAFGTFIASALMTLTCNINNFFTKFLPILSVQQSIYNLAKACFLGFSLLITIL